MLANRGRRTGRREEQEESKSKKKRAAANRESQLRSARIVEFRNQSSIEIRRQNYMIPGEHNAAGMDENGEEMEKIGGGRRE